MEVEAAAPVVEAQDTAPNVPEAAGALLGRLGLPLASPTPHAAAADRPCCAALDLCGSAVSGALRRPPAAHHAAAACVLLPAEAAAEDAPAAAEEAAPAEAEKKTPKPAAKPRAKATPASEPAAGTDTGGRARRERKQVGCCTWGRRSED